MVIYPAIDIKDGKCVRLIQGDYEKETIYSENPLEVAFKWQNEGAKFLHIVDLNGAKTGELENGSKIIEIAKKLDIPIQVGGGIRTIEKIAYLIENGINRVILGTSAVNDRNLLKDALNKFRQKIVVGIDAKDGLVSVDGWTRKSNFQAIEFAKIMCSEGVGTIIYTDISRDGMLTGPNIKAMGKMVESVGIDIIASGGVSCLNDISDLKSIGARGVIVGKALYEGNFQLKEVLKC